MKLPMQYQTLIGKDTACAILIILSSAAGEIAAESVIIEGIVRLFMFGISVESSPGKVLGN